MSEDTEQPLVIVIIPPTWVDGPWHVKSDGRTPLPAASQDEAVQMAARFAAMAERAGGRAVVRIAGTNGEADSFPLY
ncbi:hypothetical protein KPL74_04835 [Bacillus sp. NP157]|nr:hypothetical protein KPL74_04835 [Bacillus sp. NP157]